MKGHFVYKYVEATNGIEFQGFYTDREKAVQDILDSGREDLAIIDQPVEVNEMLPFTTMKVDCYWPVLGMTNKAESMDSDEL